MKISSPLLIATSNDPSMSKPSKFPIRVSSFLAIISSICNIPVYSIWWFLFEVHAASPGDEDAIQCKVMALVKADSIEETLVAIKDSSKKASLDLSFFKVIPIALILRWLENRNYAHIHIYLEILVLLLHWNWIMVLRRVWYDTILSTEEFTFHVWYMRKHFVLWGWTTDFSIHVTCPNQHFYNITPLVQFMWFFISRGV